MKHPIKRSLRASLTLALAFCIITCAGSNPLFAQKNISPSKGVRTTTLKGRYFFPPAPAGAKQSVHTCPAASMRIQVKNHRTHAVIATGMTDGKGGFKVGPFNIPPGTTIDLGPADPQVCPCCDADGCWEYLPADVNTLTPMEVDDPVLKVSCGSDNGPLIAFTVECNCTYPPCSPPCPGDVDPTIAFAALDAFSLAVETHSSNIASARTYAASQLRAAHAPEAAVSKLIGFLEHGRKNPGSK